MTMKKILLATTAIAVSLHPAFAGNILKIEPVSVPYVLVQAGNEANLLNAAIAELEAAMGTLADATAKGDGVETAQTRVDLAKQAVEEAQTNFDVAKTVEKSVPEPKIEEIVPEAKSEDVAPITKETPEVEQVVPQPNADETAPESQIDEVVPTTDELPKAETAPVTDETQKIEEVPKVENAAEPERPLEAEVPEPDNSAAQKDETVSEAKTEEIAPEPKAEELAPAAEGTPKVENAPELKKPVEAEVPKPADAVETTKTEDKPAAKEDVAAPTAEITVKEPVVEIAPVAEQIESADEKPITVLPETVSDEDKAALAAAEVKRRAESKKRRNELLGAAAVGVAVGVLVPLLGGKLVEDQGDRVVIERNGEYFIRKDENALLRRNGVRVDYEELDNGLSRETMTRPNGVQIVTTRAPNGDILRRARLFPNGDVTVLIDSLDQRGTARRNFREELPPLDLTIDRGLYVVRARDAGREQIRDAFIAPPVEVVREAYSLRDVRSSERLRDVVRRLDLDAIQFDTGSATVRQSQVPFLEETALAIADVINQDQSAVFLIEGHTDAVGGDIYNLALSDRRAETVARILIDSYGLPPENFVVEGYGEAYLKVNSQGDEPQNRRVAIRNITPLLTVQN